MEMTYALTDTRTGHYSPADAISMPITDIHPGDILWTGAGTLHWTFHEATHTTHTDGLHTVHFADGTSIRDTAHGFWYAVIPADTTRARQARQGAHAYARAFDRH